MAVTMKQVREALAPDEPDYEHLPEELGEDALPHLRKLVRDEDPLLAGKAASLAGMIGGPKAANVLKAASAHRNPAVRQAAAGSAADLAPEDAERVLVQLMDDKDSAVVRRAVIASTRVPLPAIERELERLRKSRRSAYVKKAAAKALKDVKAARRRQAME